MPPELKQLLESPTADRLVTLSLLLAIVILQLLRWIRPPERKFSLDTGPILEELKAMGHAQAEFLASFQEVQTRQTELIVTAMERQAANGAKLSELGRSLEDHRRSQEGRRRS